MVMENWREKLGAVRDANNAAAWTIAEYIDETPTAITASLIHDADPDGELPEETLYAAFMAGFAGVPEDDRIIPDYLTEAVHRLDIADYIDNPYLKAIRFPDAATRHWRFTHYTYKPYEAFICNDIRMEPDLREIPQAGYFRERFRYPAVEQDGREWMAVKPSEIETMRGVIGIAKGKVVTFGLGLGYFAFMASSKQDVESVDIVERDEEVIDLFSRHILPQFPERDKIRIIRSDAFDFMHHEMECGGYDHAFVDLWHDTADGLELYLKAKKEENYLKAKGIETMFSYWVEESLLSAYRWTRFDEIIAECGTEAEAIEKLSDKALKIRLLGLA